MMVQQVAPGFLSSGIELRGDLAPLGSTSVVDHFFCEERAALRTLLDTEPAFSPFRFLPDGLLTFLSGEKLKLSLTSETRYIKDQNDHLVIAYKHGYDCKDDRYHPKHFEPFNLNGFWIPESEGQLFSILQPGETSPLVRTSHAGKEILFLVHPKSEDLFDPLIHKYAHSQVTVPALSLSSFRTLLIAIPGATSLPQYAMVKVSLNETIGGASRVLYLKECAGSVATTSLLQHKPSKITFFKENFSFVPSSNLINPQSEAALVRGAGMIHRAIPDFLLENSPKDHVIPLFSLFGSKNRPLLDLLIQQSRKTPTQFIVDSLLHPLAEAFIDLLYIHKISIEAHGQNLLLAINACDPNDVKLNLVYRDMGGVNCLLSKKDMEKLPQALRNENYFYFNTHVKDAAEVLEGIANKVLFNLTKQFFKSEWYDCIDPEFGRWKSEMIKRGYKENWSVPGDNPDAHGQIFNLENFYRYGYFEKIFGRLLLEYMSRKGIFIEIADYHPELNYVSFLNKLCSPQNPYNTCIEIDWFRQLILQTYPIYLAQQ